MGDGRQRAKQSAARSARNLLGHWAEWIAAIVLMARGYRVVERRFKCKPGEIDLILVRGRLVSFVEVKARARPEDAYASITERQSLRMRNAADVWISRHRRYQAHEQRFDCVFVLPWRWPIHVIAGA